MTDLIAGLASQLIWVSKCRQNVSGKPRLNSGIADGKGADRRGPEAHAVFQITDSLRSFFRQNQRARREHEGHGTVPAVYTASRLVGKDNRLTLKRNLITDKNTFT